MILQVPGVLGIQRARRAAQLIELVRRRSGHGQTSALRIRLNGNMRELLVEHAVGHASGEAQGSQAETFALRVRFELKARVADAALAQNVRREGGGEADQAAMRRVRGDAARWERQV